jgi:hypothetical protein
LVPIEQLVPDKKKLCEFPIGSYVKLQCKFGCGGHLGRRAKPPNTCLEENHPMTISSKFRSYWANGFRRRFLWEFPIGSYVKLSSAVADILAGGLKCRTQFWKETTQGSFQQSLVKIGSVVSEKIFFKFHPPFFLFLAWRPSLLEVGITGHILEGGHPRTIPPRFGRNEQSL